MITKLPARFLLTVALSLILSYPLAAQRAARSSGSGDPQLLELNIFGGGTWFKAQDSGYREEIEEGGIVGARFTENITNYFSLEQDWGIYGVNNVVLRGVPGVPGGSPSFGNRLHQFSFNPVLHFTGRESRIRPFVTAGAGWDFFSPTRLAKDKALSTTPPLLFGALGPIALNSLSAKPAYNFGLGVKMHLSPRVGLRVDARDYIVSPPLFGIPGINPKQDFINSVQVTGGITFYFISLGPPLIHTFSVPPSIEITGPGGPVGAGGAAAACPGEIVTLRAPATDTIPSHKATYRWTVNGQPAGENSPEFRFTAPQNSGDYKIAVHVEDDTSASTLRAEKRATKKNPGMAADRTTSVHVKEYKAPTISCDTPSRTQLTAGETLPVHASGTASECGGELKYSWSATAGSFDGGTNSANATYNSTGVTQSSVTLTATVTDDKNGTASCTIPLTINQPPPPKPEPTPTPAPAPTPSQLDDILFVQNGSRVNNCGKRLLDQVYQQMTSGDYDVVVVGHTDPSEARGRRATQLDRERAINAAAALKCKGIEVSRIKVGAGGTTQNSPFKTNFCESSVKERAGQQVRSNDPRAKNRRVEIWLVPRGAAMPSGVNATDASSDINQAAGRIRGCPK